MIENEQQTPRKRKARNKTNRTPEMARKLAEQRAAKRAEYERRLAPRLWPSGKTFDEIDAIIRANVRACPWTGRLVRHDFKGGFKYVDTGRPAHYRVGYASGFRPLDEERANVARQMTQQPQTETQAHA